jgi:hypothetical protein
MWYVPRHDSLIEQQTRGRSIWRPTTSSLVLVCFVLLILLALYLLVYVVRSFHHPLWLQLVGVSITLGLLLGVMNVFVRGVVEGVA